MATDGLNAFDDHTRALVQALKPRTSKTMRTTRFRGIRNKAAHEAAREWLARRPGDKRSVGVIAAKHGVLRSTVVGAVFRIRQGLKDRAAPMFSP